MDTDRTIPLPSERPTMPVWPDAGRALGLGRTATYNAVDRGEIPSVRLGGRLVIPTAALRRMLQLDEPAGAA